jgi:putative RNA 2'-phosphotransferase
MKPHYVKISKFLSYVLRHRPDAIGLTLEDGGWVDVDALLQALGVAGKPVTRELLEDVVRTNDKQRFAFSADGIKIRASQGHSIEVDLGLKAVSPPDTLYHGTARRFLDSILSSGLQPQKRHHVHLSLDEQTALRVGQRHGKPIIFRVDSGAMHADGHTFFLSANGVWLTAHVPPSYLQLLQKY